MPVLSKPYVITDAGRQSEDIDRMFDDVYTEMAELEREQAETSVGVAGVRGTPGSDGDDGESIQWAVYPDQSNFAKLNATNVFTADQTLVGLRKLFFEIGTNTFIQADTGNAISFFANNLRQFRVLDTEVTVEAAATRLNLIAGQLRFPAVQLASTSANDLDDYEEGTWTPVFGGSGTTSGQVYTTQIGRYVKIGKIVHVSGRVQLSTKGTITGDIQIKALPFTLVNVTGYFPVGPIGGWSLATAYVFVCSELATNTTDATLLAATAAATSLSVLATANLNDTSALDFMFTYETAA